MMRTSQNVQDIYPLTPLQQGILYHSVEAEGSRAPYFFQLCFRIRGRLDPDALERAWQRVVQRHELLRADIQWQKTKEPLQIVYKQARVALARVTWDDIERARVPAELATWLEADRALGFEFGRAADVRLTLIRVSAEEHYLVWSYHHVSLDGWSVSNVLTEVLTAYQGEVRGVQSELPAVPPYRAYVDWLSTRSRSEAEAHFRDVLGRYEEPIEFPPQRVRRGDEAQKFAEQRVLLDQRETQQIQKLTRDWHITQNTLFQGAWALLVKLFSGANDLVFGVTVSGRPTDIAGADAMVGMFINTLPLRVELEREEQALPWLRKLQAQNTLLRQYEFSSLPQVSRLSGVAGDRALFESIFVFENYPVSSALGATDELGLDISIYEPEQELTGEARVTRRRNNFPLSLVLIPGEQLEVAFCYHSDRVAHHVVSSMTRAFEALLRALLHEPDATLGEICRHGQVVGKELLERTNAAARPYEQQGVHAAIEAHARSKPQALALQSENESLSYAELEVRANRLAQLLGQMGAGPERRVALCLRRSLDLVVGIYATLKCGAAYVPLDPKLPTLRLRAMVEDSQAVLVVSENATRAALGELSVPVVLADDTARQQAPVARVSTLVPADAAAYVIYTSGSTGRPKGVVVTHRGLTNYVQGLLDRLALPVAASMAMVSTVAADLGNTVLFGALCSGRALHLISEERVFDADAFAAYMRSARVDVLKIVPSHLEGLMQAADPGLVLPKHTLILGGESTSWALVDKIRRHGSCRIINHYGPTETTVGVLTYEYQPEQGLPDSTALPLGTPLPNSRVYVLDDALQPLPVAVAGEIHIGGEGVARQYLSRPDLTADRFIPDPFGKPGARLYRTGDRARYLEDGALEFLGRADDQIKIRGYRVELGEVRAELLALPEVADAHVLARAASKGSPRLVAYLIGDSGHRDATPLQARLRERLPDYMVPSDYIWLDKFPLTENGKLDRSALPEPGQAKSTLAVEPRSEVEQKLATIWTAVLKTDGIGTHDDFFQNGGDSLLAFQVVALARKAGMYLMPQDLFEHRTIAALAERLEAGGGDATEGAALELGPAPRDGRQPLSYAQQRLWFLWQLEPDSTAYNVPVAVKLVGALDHGALERTFGALVERHESLRTTFAEEGGESQQIIHAPPPDFSVAVLDLSDLPPAQREQRARELVETASRERFDLERGPLLRVQLLKLPADEHVLVVVIHHIVSDGWSTNILVKEFAQLYSAYRAGATPELPSLPLQYADYAVWQRRELGAQEIERQLAYWQERLGTEHPLLELPSDHPRPPIQSYRGARYELELGLGSELKALARARGTTVFTVLLAAFQVLLFRYSRQRDIRVGVPSAGRNQPELEGLIGCFVNTHVFRSALDPSESFLDLLARVEDSAHRARAHQDVPFERVVEALNPERSLSHSPLFQVMYNHQRPEYAALEGVLGLDFESLDFATRTTQFDLTLDTTEEGENLRAALTYSTDLFDRATARRLARHYRNLLASALREPALAVGRLPMLSGEEQELALTEWNRTERALPEQSTLHELIEMQAERTPERIAVLTHASSGPSVSYGELNSRANQLGHQLRKLGVGPEVLVGVALERSLDMLVGVLAVLKAGGAYVPLDPDYPAERLELMLRDAAPRVVLTHERVGARLPATDAELLYLDRDAARIASCSTENIGRAAQPQNLAYCMYTSGSTGVPKAVMVSHRALLNFLQAMREAPGIEASDRVLALTSLSFDISGLELYLPLLVGAAVVLVSRETAGSASALLDCIDRHAVTVVQATPATWQMLSEQPHFNAMRPCKILCGGEALPPELAHQLLRREEQVWNLYGPTETTIWSALYRLDASRSEPLIGKPIANTQIYLLDDSLSPVPLGVAGELYIGGMGLARGYRDRPELTAERFIPHPFSSSAGERLYRTGDLARYRSSGDIEYLGRVDQQVKIRGYRIELGEIETRLLQHAATAQAVVSVRKASDGDQRLVAYVVPRDDLASAQDGGSLREQLRAHLRATLPEYMVPSLFVFLSELPLTPNGKLNRKALPAPDSSLAQGGYAAPTSDLERKICDAWADLLKLARVGIDDNFFELGGHSLLAVRMMQTLQELAATPLPVALVFQFQTPRELARALEKKQGAPQLKTLVLLQTEGEQSPLYCIHPAGGHVLAYRELAAHFRGDRAVYGLQSKSFYRDEWIDRSIADMALHYADEILAVHAAQRLNLLGFSFGGALALEVARVCEERGRRVDFLGLVDPRDLIQSAALGTTPSRAATEAELERWLEASALKSKWQQLLERDPRSRGWLIEQFEKRELTRERLELAEEAELFSGANSLILMHDHEVRRVLAKPHVWWSSESQQKFSDWEPKLAELRRNLDLAGSRTIEGDHMSLLRSSELHIAVSRALEG